MMRQERPWMKTLMRMKSIWKRQTDLRHSTTSGLRFAAAMLLRVCQFWTFDAILSIPHAL